MLSGLAAGDGREDAYLVALFEYGLAPLYDPVDERLLCLGGGDSQRVEQCPQGSAILKLNLGGLAVGQPWFELTKGRV